jgi:hypothetical protein
VLIKGSYYFPLEEAIEPGMTAEHQPDHYMTGLGAWPENPVQDATLAGEPDQMQKDLAELDSATGHYTTSRDYKNMSMLAQPIDNGAASASSFDFYTPSGLPRSESAPLPLCYWAGSPESHELLPMLPTVQPRSVTPQPRHKLRRDSRSVATVRKHKNKSRDGSKDSAKGKGKERRHSP